MRRRFESCRGRNQINALTRAYVEVHPKRGDRQWPRRHGWSQAELAAKVGADAGQISRDENGRMTPSAEAVVKIAEVLDVTTDYLLVEASPRRSPHAPENILGDRLAVVAELADDDLTVLRSVIDRLVAKTRLRTLAGGIS